jgi:hypothetical protein
MKTNYLKANWLAPVLGVVVVAGGLTAAITYLDLEKEARAQEALVVTLDRLCHDQQLCAALKSMHDGQPEVAAQRLDLLLCDSILRLNNELASADERTRIYVEDAFRRLALLRPKLAAGVADGSASAFNEDQTAAEKILERALAGIHVAQTK